jgi:glycerophosphoryl diester phosphodiesterase
LPLETPLLEVLRASLAATPVFIQSFEGGNLRALRGRTHHPLVRLAGDRAGLGDLADVATYADAVGVAKSMVLPTTSDGHFAASTGLVEAAHRCGLAVHVWTFRAENTFLPAALRIGGDGAMPGRLGAEIHAFLDAGVDGIFADQPDLARAAVDAWCAQR